MSYTIKKAKKALNKSGEMRKKMYSVMPLMEIGDSFEIPAKDFHGPFEDFQKTVAAILCIYRRDKEKNKKFSSHLNRKKKTIEVRREY